MRNIGLWCCVLALSACHTQIVKQVNTPSQVGVTLTPSQVVAQSGNHEWRLLDAENTIYLTLETGVVIIEMLPLMAPKHVENTKALIRQGVFDNTQFYRVLDGFVAQGGPMFESESDRKPLAYGQYSVPSELTVTKEWGDEYINFDGEDGYADETGYLHSFPIGRDFSTGESWLLHCYGALGMGRANELDSGGTELYIVNGHAQRYLDRNVTIFGRVIDGMHHIQALQRSNDFNGVVDLTDQNIIESIRIAADMPAQKLIPIEVLKSNSQSFVQLLEARKNRTADWFVYQHDYMDACGVPLPVRLKKTEKEHKN